MRRLIGYDRYEGEEAWEAMSRLYAVLRLYINFFQPTLKLSSKTREGSKTIKKYDKALTPYQRVIASEHIPQQTKDKLKQQYQNLDPIVLQREMKLFQNKLWQLAWRRAIVPVAQLNSDSDQISKESEQVFYRKTRKPRKPVRKHNWRSRKDPFETVQNFINLEVQLNQNISAIEILSKLIKKYPEKFSKKHLRTLQRRLKNIRDDQDIREKRYQELMISKKFMTTEA